MHHFTYDKLILFGDSITQGAFQSDFSFTLGNALQGDYIRKFDVLDRGYGGYNARWGKEILPEILATESKNATIKLVVIFYGTNDCKANEQGVGIEEYKKTLSFMVELCEKYNTKAIVVGPAVYSAALGNPSDASSMEAHLKYSNAAKEVAERCNVPFVDLWHAFTSYLGSTEEEMLKSPADMSELLVDGVHFAPIGYKIFHQALTNTITTAYPELAKENVRERLVPWNEVDESNIKKSIFKHESF
ncbi:Isoamyl acetate-hydrolyzing esterase [Meyerozyma sp. JA9]|nr:Isoamyl acetate-hydrolyzing esterase [Meyerozyma sp. JA9]